MSGPPVGDVCDLMLVTLAPRQHDPGRRSEGEGDEGGDGEEGLPVNALLHKPQPFVEAKAGELRGGFDGPA